jgi:hypothetical protein
MSDLESSADSSSSSRIVRGAAAAAREKFPKKTTRVKKADKMAGLPQELAAALSDEQKRILQAHVNVAVERAKRETLAQHQANQQNANPAVPHIINIDSIVVRQPNQNVKVPRYDKKKMTAEFYLKEVKSYFAAQGITNNLVTAIISILDQEVKAWYHHIKTEGMTWEEFCLRFIAKYDTWVDRQTRLQLLINRRQKEDEPIESFVWEMMSIAKQVFPNEEIEDSVRRCRLALVPKLKCLIQDLPQWTPENLIERCKVALIDIKDQDSQSSGRLPPINRQWTTRGRDNNFRGGERRYGNHQSDRSSNDNISYRNQNHTSSGQGQIQQPRGNVNFTNQPQPTTSNPNAAKRNYNGQQQSSSRGNHATTMNKKAKLNCYRCREPGHIASQCKKTIAFCGDDADLQGRSRSPEENGMDGNETLNEEGRQ